MEIKKETQETPNIKLQLINKKFKNLSEYIQSRYPMTTLSDCVDSTDLLLKNGLTDNEILYYFKNSKELSDVIRYKYLENLVNNLINHIKNIRDLELGLEGLLKHKYKEYSDILRDYEVVLLDYINDIKIDLVISNKNRVFLSKVLLYDVLDPLSMAEQHNDLNYILYSIIKDTYVSLNKPRERKYIIVNYKTDYEKFIIAINKVYDKHTRKDNNYV